MRFKGRIGNEEPTEAIENGLLGEGKSGKYSRGGHSGQRERHVQRPWGRDTLLREVKI